MNSPTGQEELLVSGIHIPGIVLAVGILESIDLDKSSVFSEPNTVLASSQALSWNSKC